MTIAHLPMYDVPQGRAAQGRFWDLVQRYLPGAPDLTVPTDLWSDWRNPDLFLSQTCGLPFRAKLYRHVSLVGTPDPKLDGCPPGYYRSAIVARTNWRGDLTDDLTLGYNDPMSQSGWAAPWADGITGTQRIHTGSHAASAQAVKDGTVDIAALDAVTWQLLQRHWPHAANLRVVHWTTPTPALPFITSLGQDADTIAQGVQSAIHGLPPKDQTQLHLNDLVQIPAEIYGRLAIPPLP